MSHIGIDFRFLADPQTSQRGMGRYTIEQFRAVLKCDPDNEYLLFCHQTDDISRIPSAIRQQPNVRIHPIFRNETRAIFDFAGMLRRSEEVQSLLEPYRLSLFHLTTPMTTGVGTPLLGFDVCPLVATHYDLIPRLYPDQYLADPMIRRLYFVYATQLRRADHLVAISQAVKREAIQYLDMPEERIDVAYPIPAPVFRPLPLREVQAKLNALWERLRVSAPSSYIVSLLAAHHSKNLETLLKAYGRLPSAFRKQTPLVLVFKISDAERNSRLELARQAGIHESEIIFTDYVTDEELNTLYNGATVLVHPARYEGFGLPVIEAMRCGTPVITTTAASLPEVGGNAAILVDPEQIDGFVEAIMRVCADQALQASMRERSLEHAATFTEENLGQNTISAYHKTISQANEAPVSSNGLRVALWTPLPPDQTRIAEQSVDLLEPLSQQSDLEVFVRDGVLPNQSILDHLVVHHHSAMERRQRQHPFDLHFYQMGASSFHNFMYPYMEAYPGVLILHDLVMGFHVYRELMRLPEGEATWLAFLTETEGGAFTRQFQSAHKLKKGEAFLNDELVLQAFIDNSLAIIVDFEENRRLINARYPNAIVYFVAPDDQKTSRQPLASNTQTSHEPSLIPDTTINQYLSVAADVSKQTAERPPTQRMRMPKLPAQIENSTAINAPQNAGEALGYARHYYGQFENFRLWENLYSRYNRFTRLPLVGFTVRTAIRIRHLGHLFAAVSGFMTSTLAAQQILEVDLKQQVLDLQQRLAEQQRVISGLERELAASAELSQSLQADFANIHEQLSTHVSSMRMHSSGVDQLPVSAFVGQVANILQCVEQHLPELAHAAVLDCFVESTGTDADPILQEAARYFGSRQSVESSNAVYYIGTPKFPIDERLFETMWGHKILPEGYFVLIELASSAIEAHLAPLIDERILFSYGQFRFRVWRKP